MLSQAEVDSIEDTFKSYEAARVNEIINTTRQHSRITPEHLSALAGQAAAARELRILLRNRMGYGEMIEN